MYYANQYIITYLATTGGINNSQTTGIKVQSATGIDTAKPGVALLNYSDPLNEDLAEWIYYETINGSNEFTGVVRGAEKGSAKAHTELVAIAFPFSEIHTNQFADIFHGTVTSSLADNLLLENQASAPTTPSSGYTKLYVDTDGTLKKLTSGGTPSNVGVEVTPQNILKNGNFINNSTNGYGGTPDDWTNSSANPVQGGFPTFTKQELIDLLGVTDGQIEGLWNLNNDVNDLSSNGYNLTASGSPVYSDDGLMAKALDLEASSSQYASIANASSANLDISGDQTFFCWVKPESLGNAGIMGKSDSGVTAQKALVGNNIGQVSFTLVSTASVDVTSDVKMETGKWYFLCGVFDDTNNLVKIWVNGVKKQATATETPGTVTSAFSIGRRGDQTAYYDGLVQCAGVLSTALTDDQVKRLFAATSYKGIKVRRNGSDGYVYQNLPQDLVERLRGKTLTVRAQMTQEVASTGQISIYDGTESASTTSATLTEQTGIASKTISATATQIQIRLKVSTSNGSVWFEQVSLYEGSGSLPYAHSSDDWSRFPRLLRMDVPAVVSAYQFEENRWYSHTATLAGFSSATDTTISFQHRGKSAIISNGSLNSYIGGTSNATNFTFSLPVVPKKTAVTLGCFCVQDNGTNQADPGIIGINANSVTANVWKTIASNNFTASGFKYLFMSTANYEID